MAGCQSTAITGAQSGAVQGPCLDELQLMTYNANSLFTVIPGPEYECCKILKTASTLRLDVMLVQETHMNGLVDWHVQDVEKASERYGYSVMWLHAKTYINGGLMILVKDGIHIEGHGPLPLTPPLDERVLRVDVRLPSG